MSAPPPKNPSSPSAEEAASPQQADLSHFKKRSEAEDDVPYKKRANVMGALSSLADNIKTKPETEKPLPSPASVALNEKGRKSKKYVIAAVIALVVVPVLAVIVAGIPAQIARSKAFAAYEEGRHDEAFREFRGYLRDKPGDHEAAFYAAQAAMRAGDFAYAADTLGKIAGVPEYAGNTEFLFVRALALAPAPEAAPVLDSLVSQSPEHTGGRLLRGVMLARENEMQRAREDFLQADSIIRGDKNHDSAGIWEVNRRIASVAGEILPQFELPAADSGAPALRRLSARLGIPAPAGAYINRYLPVPPSDAEAEEIGADGIVGIYYTLMLLADDQTNEARMEFSKMSPETMNDSPAGGLRGIHSVLVGDYAEAAEVFRPLSELSPPRAESFFNLANATYSASPTEEGARRAAEFLSRAIELNPEMAAARHNRAMLRLMDGDDDGAKEDLDAIDGAGAAQTPLLRALAALAANPRDENIGAFLADTDAKSADAKHIRIAHLFARGDYEQGLSLLQQEADAGQKWDAANRLYARRLAEAGLFMRARNILRTRAPQDSPAVLYEIALLEMASDGAAGGAEILAQMEEQYADSFYTLALRALILRRGGDEEAAKTAVSEALELAETPRQKRRIALASADLLLAAAPDMLRSLLSESDVLEPAAAALLARLSADDNPEGAALLALDAAARNPFFDAQLHAGIALTDVGRGEDALSALQGAAEWRPVNIPLLSRLRQLHSEAGESEDAAFIGRAIENIKLRLAGGDDEHSEVLSIDSPKDAKLIQSISRVRAKKATPKKALERFSELLDAAPEERKPLLQFQRGTFLLAVRDYENCEKDIRAAIASGKLPPERARRADLYLGKALVLQDKFREAAKVYRRLADANPQIALYRRLTGGALSNAGDHESATAYLEETAALFPADLESYFSLAAAWRQAQETENAVSVLRKAARIAPLYVPIYAALSRAQQITDIAVAKENSVIANELSAR